MKSILVIDDNSDVRQAIASALVEAGYSVREAQDGRAGIQSVISHRPDLILCDVRMPGLDGYRALEAVRKCPATAAIPFILMSGSLGQNDFRRGMASGADDYLIKPFTPGELIATVKSRFARQTHLHADMAHQVENCHFEEFRGLSQELTAPIHGLLSAVAARLRHQPADENTTVSATDSHQAAYCLD